MKELRNKSTEELNEQLIELRKEQFNLRMQRGTGSASRPHMFRDVKKNIARIKTLLNEQRSGN